ncbi:MAG: sulfatase-like hydrolase/transferase [Hungatella sp.]|jgi:choline-sulfatase|nr:sulfatase-like hydrolase/transferase [Hungatella sp.]
MNRHEYPNILFLMTDEHRPDLAGFAGNSVVRTPSLDRLAKDSVIFENAYTPSPVCIPARQCMMSGQLPRTCGCEIFGDDLPPFYRTFARTFSENAYYTVCCGKLHHTGPDQMQGWQARIGCETRISEKFIPGMDQEKLQKFRTPKSELRWTNVKEVLRAGAGRCRVSSQDEYTLLGTLNAIEHILESPYYDKQQLNQPLLLKASFTLPHYPYFCDEGLFKYYLNRVPVFGPEEIMSGHPYLDTKHLEIGKDVLYRDVQRATAAYYAMVETVDSHIGKILDKLHEAGQNLDDWIIVFTSDHGEMLGEHGIWAKHKFYESSVRVPLFIRFPSRFAARRVRENVNLCDLYATLCHLCGLETPDNLDSRSLVPLMNGDASHWNNESVSQYRGEYLMIKQDHLKYHYYGEDMPEVLWDLEKDPGETVNLMEDPRYENTAAAMRKRRASLGFGPGADPNYKNAGYEREAVL